MLAPYGMKRPRIPSAEISYFPSASGPMAVVGALYCGAAVAVAARKETAASLRMEVNIVGGCNGGVGKEEETGEVGPCSLCTTRLIGLVLGLGEVNATMLNVA